VERWRRRWTATHPCSQRTFGHTIEQFDLNDPDAPQVILNVVRVNDTYELRSLSFESHFNTLWILLGPLLPLPAHEADDKRIVTFTVAENEQANIASGALEVQRAVDAEHVLWHIHKLIR
jgi:hypothetical protein